jgi:chromosome segregation ATPase
MNPQLESDVSNTKTAMTDSMEGERDNCQSLQEIESQRVEDEFDSEQNVLTNEMTLKMRKEDSWNEEKATLQQKMNDMERELKTMSTLKEKLAQTEKELNEVKASSGNSITAKRALMLAMEKKSKRVAFDSSGNNPESTKKIQDCEEEIKELKQKLSDRDKTISATIKASSMQEKKIDTLRKRVAELEMESTSKDASAQSAEKVSHLQNTISTLQTTKQNMSKQIADLHKQISGIRAKGGSLTTTMTSNDALIQEYKIKIQERDDAISSLVKTSITQEQQITNLRDELFEIKGKTGHIHSTVRSNGPTWDEFYKVKQESEMFAGQIIELDEEIEELHHRLEDNLKSVDDEVLLKHEATIKRLYASLQREEDINRDLEDEISELRSKLKKNLNISRIQSELEDVEETNAKLEKEIRELRRKLRTSQLESEKVPDLESELSILRESMNKLQVESTKRQIEKVVDMKTQVDLERAKEQRDAFESQLRDSLVVNHDLELSIKSYEEKQSDLMNDIALLRTERDDLLKSLKTQQEQNKEVQMEEMNSRKVFDNQLIKIRELETDIDEQNNIISALTSEVKRLRSKSSTDSEANEIIIALTDEVKKLREKHLSNENSDIVEAMSNEVRTLRTKLLESDNNVEKNKITEMEGQITTLKNEIKKLREAPSKVSNESDVVKELKKQLEEAEKGRTQFEKTMISTYERKLNLMQMNKDVTIDGLRKELTKSKANQKESETELINKIRTLESERREFEAELHAKMQHKNARIEFLEQHLSAHEQVSGHMRDDLDQLQSRMENMSVGRRAEMEELQEDLIDAQSKITKYERDITSLKMKMEETKLTHQNEVSRLQKIIDSIESDSQSPMMRDVARESEQRLEKEYRGQMESLQSKINEIQEENRNLKYEMEKIEKQASRNDKWRNSALQEQVIKLQQRLKDYESETGSVMSAPSRRKSSTSPRVPRSPAGSFNSG